MKPPRLASWYAERAACSYPVGASPDEIQQARRANGERLRLAAKMARDLYHAQARWEIDPDVSPRDWGEEHHWPLWQCTLWHEGRAVASLGGIDFGPDGEPHDGSDIGDHALVVEAELALEAFQEE